MKEDCLFCKIIKKEIPSFIVFEDEKTLAFLTIEPVSQGHTLIIPKIHSENLHTIDDQNLFAVMQTVKKVASHVKEKLNADGINIAQNNEVAAGQAIFHTHFHIIPRFLNDGLISWKHSLAGIDALTKVHAHIKI